MSLKSLFVPEIIKTFHSDFNGEIKLVRFAKDLRLDVGGLTQSGSVMVWIWSTAIKNLLPRNYSPKNILLLGLGGGSALFWLRRRFPAAQLIAVEIDPVIIEIARKHFGLGKLKGLEIINQDAVTFIKTAKKSYSLILVDCYQGYETPLGFEQVKVLSKMRSLCDSLFINRLYWDDFKLKTDDSLAKLSPHFRIRSVYTASNLVVSLS